jgi:CBS domain-containing protein
MNMRVTEVMRGNPVCCVPATSARKAATIMRQFNVGVLLVVDDLDRRKLLGIITDRDLCVRVLAEAIDPARAMVQDFMTSNPVTCTAEEDIGLLLSHMQKHQIRRVPVVNAEGRVEGIVTDRDLLENPDINSHDLCVALGRIVASKIKTRDTDSVTAFP